MVGQSAPQKGLSTPGGAVDEKILVLTDPIAGGETRQLRTVQTATSAEVEVFEGSALLQLRELQQASESPVLAVGELALDQQAEAILSKGRLWAVVWVICSESAMAMPWSFNWFSRDFPFKNLQGE